MPPCLPQNQKANLTEQKVFPNSSAYNQVDQYLPWTASLQYELLILSSYHLHPMPTKEHKQNTLREEMEDQTIHIINFGGNLFWWMAK